MSNYRPISVIGHIAKMVEQLVRSQLVSYLQEHAFISPDQSAYLACMALNKQNWNGFLHI